eukprot:1187086-Prorocentrum_minimum.AAC.6
MRTVRERLKILLQSRIFHRLRSRRAGAGRPPHARGAGGADAADGSGREMGTFVGISGLDYLTVLARSGVAASPYSATGGALSVAAGRMAFVYGAQVKT